MSVFARLRQWFRGPAVDRATARDLDAIKEKRVQVRLSQSDSPSPFPGGIVTPDRTSTFE
jgi:hypothetical protein